ncbi:MAG: FAD-binding oxidoreductase [Myxococcales bacterium]|nr:FAD-binding oxidoreductase [Myxococcales bacterium]USN51342.1 MAG: FAD-binding oxidoreductase [Myxococcales bacterium]
MADKQAFFEFLKTKISKNRILLGKDEKFYAQCDQSTNVSPSLPLAVIKAITIDELIWVTKACINHCIPLVIRGAGTGKSGGAIATPQSVIIDITKLNRIIEIDRKNLTAEVEPGVILGDFQTAVKAHGLFYPPDPASWTMCTIGGNVAENASGPSTLKYGSTRDYLLGGQAILGTGEVINFGKRCPKGVSGYDIASLLCGSEGTLAVFTKFTLRLLPLPKDESAALFLFEKDSTALKAVTRVLHCGHLPKTLEYIDKNCISALKHQGHFKHLGDNCAALLIECDASYLGGAQKQLEMIQNDLEDLTLRSEYAHSKEEHEHLRKIRSSLSQACSSWLGKKLSEDMAIPLCSMEEFSYWFKAQEQKPHLLCALFGHAGDGNLHVQIMYNNEKYSHTAQDLRHRVLLKVLSLGGTLSAEHGIGLQKKSYLHLEHSQALIDIQKGIKKTFDPHNVLNPGKIFDM